MKSLSFGVYGVYGKNNLGDEALLRSVMADVLSIHPNSEFTVFCSDPSEVSKFHGVHAVSRKPFNNFFDKLSLIKQMDVFIIGGGTLLYEQGNFIKNFKAILAFYFWPILAKLLRVKTLAYGQGLGPIHSLSMKVAIRCLPVIFDLITLRDNLSIEYINSGSNIYVTSDPVAASELYNKKVSNINDETDLYLLVAFRSPQAGKSELIIQWIQAISVFAKNKKCKIILFPTQLSKKYFEDEPLLEVLYQQLVEYGINPENIQKVGWSTIEEGIGYLQRANVVISNRLHALLLAAKAGVPCVGLGGKDKILGCLNMIGIDKPIYFMDQEKIASGIMNKILKEAWDIPQKGKANLIDKIQVWAKQEPTNISCLKEIITNKHK